MKAAIMAIAIVAAAVVVQAGSTPAFAASFPSDSVVTRSERIAGKNAYDRAVSVSKLMYQKANTVIIASGEVYADGLAGGPLADRLNAPILYAKHDRIDQQVLDEINRLGVSQVYILGGPQAIEDPVLENIRSAVPNAKIDRIAGATRYSTAAAIADKLDSMSDVKANKIFFASGENYPDALCAGTAASNEQGVVLYIPGSGVMNAETQEYLNTLDCSSIDAVITGGTEAIDKPAESTLAKASFKSVVRVAGETRYKTAVELCRYEQYNSSLDAVIAAGSEFQDAMTGSVLAAHYDIPLLLADANDYTTAFDYLCSCTNHKLYSIGGLNKLDKDITTFLECNRSTCFTIEDTSAHFSPFPSTAGLAHYELNDSYDCYGESWLGDYNIVYINGRIGYIPKSKSRTSPALNTDVFVRTRTNLYIAPLESGTVLTTVPQNDTVEIISFTDDGWSYVRYNDRIGYMRTDTLGIYAGKTNVALYDGDISAATRNELSHALEAIPDPIWTDFCLNEYHLLITDKDVGIYYMNNTPNVAGCFSVGRKKIIINDKYVEYALAHELGHFMDWQLGHRSTYSNISFDPKFGECYEAEKDNTNFAHYTQLEFFAETASRVIKNDRTFISQAPRSCEYVRNCIESY